MIFLIFVSFVVLIEITLPIYFFLGYLYSIYEMKMDEYTHLQPTFRLAAHRFVYYLQTNQIVGN